MTTIKHLLASVAAAAFVLALAAPAVAFDKPPAPSGPTDTNPGVSQGPTSDDGTDYSGTAGGCSIVSTSKFLGAHCADGGLQGRKSIKGIMKGETFHQCWMDQMSAEEHQATGYEDTDEFVWYMHRCISGIDPKTLDVTGPIGIYDEYPVKIRRGEFVETLGPNQEGFVKGFSAQIPYPIAVTSPTSQPRVGGWLSFADGSGTHDVPVTALGVQLLAHQDSITVKPLGEANAAIKTCPDYGHFAEQGEKPVPNGNCWFQYLKSSADQDGNTYPVKITAHWTVTQTVNGGAPLVINQFTKSQVTKIPVTEIQAINVD